MSEPAEQKKGPARVVADALQDGIPEVAIRVRALAYAVRTMDENQRDANELLDLIYDYAHDIIEAAELAGRSAKILLDWETQVTGPIKAGTLAAVASPKKRKAVRA